MRPERIPGKNNARRANMSISRWNDRALRALRRNDGKAWDDFFADFDGLIRSVVSWRKWHFDFHVAEDLTQQIRHELMRSVGRVENAKRIPGFVRRVCVNRCIDEVRRQVKERNLFTSFVSRDEEGDERTLCLEGGSDFNPVRVIMAKDRAGVLRDLIRKIDPFCHSVLRLFYGQGFRYKEISEKLEVAVNTVGTRLARCLEKLRGMAKQSPLMQEVCSEGVVDELGEHANAKRL